MPINDPVARLLYETFRSIPGRDNGERKCNKPTSRALYAFPVTVIFSDPIGIRRVKFPADNGDNAETNFN